MALTTFTIDSKDVTLDQDVNTFTAAELGTIERYTGMTVTTFGEKLGNRSELSALAWTSLVWIAARRAGSSEPFDTFAERMSLVELLKIIEGSRTVSSIVPNRSERRSAERKAAKVAPVVEPASGLV